MSRVACSKKLHVRDMRRLLQWLAVVLVTLVCAGFASPGQRITALGASLEVSPPEAATTTQRPPRRQMSHHWLAGTVRLNLETVKEDLDDGDALFDAVDGAAVGFESVSFPREAGRALRCQPRVDTSRFAVGTGLPRGPPT